MALKNRPKIAIIGSGNIGGILAYHATSRKLGDIVLYDNVEGRAEGKSIDISAAAREDEFDLRITGTKRSEVIGKELKIRRALSTSHLKSSAFEVERDPAGAWILRGRGWGHGVGLCQIGAAVMADRGYDYRSILKHYYPGTDVVQ